MTAANRMDWMEQERSQQKGRADGTSESASPRPVLPDLARAREITALDALDDGTIIALLRSDQHNVFLPIALYHRHAGLVRSLIGEQADGAALVQRVWLAAFDELYTSQESVLPLAGWLARLVARTLTTPAESGGGGSLPAPLAWYMRNALDRLPLPLRITLVLTAVQRRTPEAVATFFRQRQQPYTATDLPRMGTEAQRLFVDTLPVDVRRLYFGDPLEVEAPIALLPELGLSVEAEIERFDRWHGTEPLVEASELAVEIPTYTPTGIAETPVPVTPAVRPSAQAWLGVAFVFFGMAGLGAVAYQSGWLSFATSETFQPAVESNSEPRTPVAASEAAAPTPSAPTTTRPPLAAPRPAAPQAAVLPKPGAVPTLPRPIPVSALPKPIPARVATPGQTAPPVATALPSTAAPTAAPATATPPTVDGLPLVDDAPNRKQRYVVVLIPDPTRQRLAQVNRLQKGVYYRNLGGIPHIQYGAFRTTAQANAALQRVRAAGYEALLARS